MSETNPNPLPVDGMSREIYMAAWSVWRKLADHGYLSAGAADEGPQGYQQSVIEIIKSALPPAAGGVSEARVEAAAEAMWRAEASESGALARARATSIWADQLPELRAKWRHFARAALAASDALAPAAGQPVAIKGLVSRIEREFYRDYPTGDSEATVRQRISNILIEALAPIPERVNAVVEALEDAAKVAEADHTPAYGPHRGDMEALAERQRTEIARRIRALASLTPAKE